MARIEWVQHRLENWALWHERGRGGGLGYATQSILLSDPTDRGRDVWVPVDEIDAAVTDEGVEALKLGHGHLHKTLQLIYLRGCGIKAAARQMARAESTIKAQLDRADQLLALFFSERAKRKAEEARILRDALEKARGARLQGVTLPPAPRSARVQTAGPRSTLTRLKGASRS